MVPTCPGTIKPFASTTHILIEFDDDVICLIFLCLCDGAEGKVKQNKNNG